MKPTDLITDDKGPLDFNKEREAILKSATAYFEAHDTQHDFKPGVTYVPASAKLLTGMDIACLVDSCLDGWLTAGRYANEFEKQFARLFGATPNALLVNSGSSANLLAISCLSSPMVESMPLGRI